MSTVQPKIKMRVLVTGSREWTDKSLIASTLLLYATRYVDATLVHGDCERGADAIADEFWKWLGLPVERHPADWTAFGKRAGFKRNAEMVATNPDVCLAFIKNNSKGATHTVKLCEMAGIPVKQFHQ